MASIQDRLNNLARDYAIAWSSGDPQQVAGFFAPDARISTNGNDPVEGHAAITEIAKAVFADFPDLELRCDMMRWADDHAIFVWTREGHHAETGNHVIARGWEEWDLSEDHKVQTSLGWFDAEDYQRQIDGK